MEVVIVVFFIFFFFLIINKCLFFLIKLVKLGGIFFGYLILMILEVDNCWFFVEYIWFIRFFKVVIFKGLDFCWGIKYTGFFFVSLINLLINFCCFW